MRIAALSLLFILIHECLCAQQVTGFARDDKGKPLSGATVALKNNKDSSVVKIGISGATGQYEFSAVAPGHYFITLSHIGYVPASSASFDISVNKAVTVPEITLSHASKVLMETLVTARKPLVEVKPDKIVLNVEGSINEVGSNALELLRKSPGVSVDKDNNLNLNGKNGVQVYVDGRPTYLDAAPLADYLTAIQSTSIESIEIIGNPSAKYEAAGNAGIINIRLKKNQAYGNNLSLNGSYAIGIHSKYTGGFSFNHRDQHMNIFGDYTYSWLQNEGYSTLYRTQLDTFFLQNTTLITTNSTHNYKFGTDYFINSHSTLGVVINGTSQGHHVRSTSATPIIYAPTNVTDRVLQANNRTDGSRDNFNADANYRYTDSSGRELNIDADYGLYHLRSDQLQPNDYYDSSGKTLLYSHDYHMFSPSDIHIYTLKTDYETPFARGRLGFGAKTSYVTTRNNFQQYDVQPYASPPGSEYDSLSSNDFNYRENINAAYATYKRTLKAWVLEGGLRAENTNIRGTSVGYQENPSQADHYMPYDSSFTRHYTDLFPSASVSYNKNPARQWTLGYSRRIDRPAYQSLNPFEFKLDDYTFSRGNTLLRPQYTNSLGLSFLYQYKFNVNLNYSHTKDLATSIVDTTQASKMLTVQKNLASQDVLSLTMTYPFQYRWYSLFISFSGYYQLNKADFGAGRTIDLNVFNATIYTQHSFRLGGGWTGELIEYYSSPNVWEATLRANSIWNLDGGLQKSLFGGRGTLKAAVTDIFKTQHWSAISDFAGQHIYVTGGSETRQFKVNFTYRLGNNQLSAARRHNTGDEDENKRVQ